jgi:hypothetical protein
MVNLRYGNSQVSEIGIDACGHQSEHYGPCGFGAKGRLIKLIKRPE